MNSLNIHYFFISFFYNFSEAWPFLKPRIIKQNCKVRGHNRCKLHTMLNITDLPKHCEVFSSFRCSRTRLHRMVFPTLSPWKENNIFITYFHGKYAPRFQSVLMRFGLKLWFVVFYILETSHTMTKTTKFAYPLCAPSILLLYSSQLDVVHLFIVKGNYGERKASLGFFLFTLSVHMADLMWVGQSRWVPPVCLSSPGWGHLPLALSTNTSIIFISPWSKQLSAYVLYCILYYIVFCVSYVLHYRLLFNWLIFI